MQTLHSSFNLYPSLHPILYSSSRVTLHLLSSVSVPSSQLYVVFEFVVFLHVSFIRVVPFGHVFIVVNAIGSLEPALHTPSVHHEQILRIHSPSITSAPIMLSPSGAIHSCLVSKENVLLLTHRLLFRVYPF